MATLSVQDLTVSEGDGFATVLVSLSEPVGSVVSVRYAVESWTAIVGADQDLLPATGTLQFAAGETTQAVRIELVGSSTVGSIEPAERFRLRLADPVNATLAGEGFGWITIVDNDTQIDEPVLVVGDLVVDEAAGQARFVVTLGQPYGQSSNRTVTVDYQTVDGSATAGSDYVARSGTLTFLPGQSSQTVAVSLLDDRLGEGAESFGLSLSNPTIAVIGRGLASATIGANDNAQDSASEALPAIAVADLTVGEGDTYADVVVSLSAPARDPVSVAYRTESWTAQVGATRDVLPLDGRLTFNPGETTKVVRIDLLAGQSSDIEATERFKLVLDDPTHATLAGEGFGWITIVDNDTRLDAPGIHVRDVTVDEASGTANFVVTLGRVFGEAAFQAVTVDYRTVDGSATAGSDYVARNGTLTFLPGESTHTIAVPLLDDSLAEGAETFGLHLDHPTSALIVRSDATATLGANDAPVVAQPVIGVPDLTVGEGDLYADVVVSLSAPSADRVTVGYRTGSWTAIAGSAFDLVPIEGQLSFEPGQTTRVVRVDLVGAGPGNDIEPLERFKFTLFDPTHASLAGQGFGWVTVIDNDTRVDTPEVFVRDVIVDETAGTAEFVVTLGRVFGQASPSTVTVDYHTVDGSAKAGSDYLATRGTLTFLPGETTHTVSVPLIDDPWTEPEESFQLLLDKPSMATLVDGHARAVIAANDAVPHGLPVITLLGTTVGELAGVADVRVQLSAPSDQPVTVQYATQSVSATAADYTPASGTLTFAPGQTSQVVHVDIVADSAAEGTETFTLNLSAPTQATLGAGTATIAIVDVTTGSVPHFWLGLSDDLYSVSAPSDAIVEAAGGGNDTVVARCDYVLPAEVENLVLADAAAVNGTGNAADNIFVGNAADNRIDGRGGIDTMVFHGPASAYAVSGSGDARTVSGSAEGRDTLLSIERLQFSDVVLAGDTSPGGNTYAVLALFNAGFDRLPSIAELSQWTRELDRLASPVELAQEMIDHYAPGITDEAMVSYLWGTVVEAPPNAGDLDRFVALLRDGTTTQASLLDLAANHPLNTIELTGVAGTTLTLDAAWFPPPGG